MAGVKDRELDSFGPWPLGINNIAGEGELPTDENGGRLALREADNVDFDGKGWLRSRHGQLQVYAGDLSHSLWSGTGMSFGLFVDEGELQVFRPDERARSLGVPMSNLPVSYELINDRIYFTNRNRCGVVTLDQEVHAWAPDQPPGQPTLRALDGYSLEPGQYQVAVTFTDELGRESGTPKAAAIVLATGQGLELRDIPQPTHPATNPIVNVYCSAPNEKVLRRALVLPAGITTGLIACLPSGPTLQTQFLEPMPAGQIVRLFRGRLLIAIGREVIYSEALRYGLYHAQRNRQRFAETIDLLEPVAKGGYYVASGHRTYWLSGDEIGSMGVEVKRSVGAVPGSVRVPGNVLGFESTEDFPVWVDTKGNFCVGLPGGQIKVLKDGEAVIDGADRAALLFREGEGLQQVIAALSGRRTQGLAFSDKAAVHVLHDGSAG